MGFILPTRGAIHHAFGMTEDQHAAQVVRLYAERFDLDAPVCEADLGAPPLMPPTATARAGRNRCEAFGLPAGASPCLDHGYNHLPGGTA